MFSGSRIPSHILKLNHAEMHLICFSSNFDSLVLSKFLFFVEVMRQSLQSSVALRKSLQRCVLKVNRDINISYLFTGMYISYTQNTYGTLADM